MYGVNISNVSVVNSTNSSNFQTGILWDASDSVNGNYSGTEDVIFISDVQKQLQGEFGIYDYEIKIPSRLREYNSPNNLNTITLYYELE